MERIVQKIYNILNEGKKEIVIDYNIDIRNLSLVYNELIREIYY
jgi:hypothetical protein